MVCWQTFLTGYWWQACWYWILVNLPKLMLILDIGEFFRRHYFQDIGDKRIEVVGLENCLHMGQVGQWWLDGGWMMIGWWMNDKQMMIEWWWVTMFGWWWIMIVWIMIRWWLDDCWEGPLWMRRDEDSQSWHEIMYLFIISFINTDGPRVPLNRWKGKITDWFQCFK